MVASVVAVAAVAMLRGLEGEVGLEEEAGKIRLPLVVVEANGLDLGEALNLNLEKGIACKSSETALVELRIAKWFQSIDMLEGNLRNPRRSVVSDSVGLDFFPSKQMTFRELEEEVESVAAGFLA